jgi:hypothetical protein
VTQGPDKGELNVSWDMPTRRDLLATVIYQGRRTGSRDRQLRDQPAGTACGDVAGAGQRSAGLSVPSPTLFPSMTSSPIHLARSFARCPDSLRANS